MGPSYYPPVSGAYNQPRSGKIKYILIIAGVLVALIGMLAVIFSGGGDIGEELALATGRQTELATFATENQETVKDSALARINADAGLFFQSDVHELTKHMNAAGIGEVPEELTAISEEDTTKLEEADGQGRFDETYVKMLEQKIDAQQALTREIFGKTKDPAEQATLSSVYEHLEVIRKELDTL